MSRISGGLVNATNLTVTGSQTGAVTTTNLTVTGNLTTGSISAPNLDLINLTVPGSFDVTGLNNYTANYQAGDLISYNNVISPSDSSNIILATTARTYYDYWAPTLNAPAPPLPAGDARVYQIVYWGYDGRSNGLSRMSACLIIPNVCKESSGTIVSYKHDALGTVQPNSTLANFIKQINTITLAGNPGSLTPNPYQGGVDFTALTIAGLTGYPFVCADNASYGRSTGNYNFLDTATEARSQYNAIIATTQLMKVAPHLFNVLSNYKIPTTEVPVVNTGYGLGGCFSGMIAQLIKSGRNTTPFFNSTEKNTNPNSIPIKLVTTIAGAPLNWHKLVKTTTENPGSPTSLLNSALFLLYNSQFGETVAINGTRPYLIADVLPIFQGFYSSNSGSAVNGLLDTIGLTTSSFENFKAQIGSPGVGNISSKIALNQSAVPYYYGLPTSLNPSPDNVAGGWITPSVAYNYTPGPNDTSDNILFNRIKQAAFYTNKFYNTEDLSGTSINIIYSLQDELCCYDSSHWNYGTASKDLIINDLSSWVVSPPAHSSLFFNYGINGLGRSTPLQVPVCPFDTSANQTNTTLATALSIIQNESTDKVTAFRFDTSGYLSPWNGVVGTGMQHFTFLYDGFAPVLLAYLTIKTL